MIEYLHHVATYVGAGRKEAWRPNDEFRLEPDSLELFLTPEEAVMLDAALEGEARLRALRIKRLHDGRDLSKWLTGPHLKPSP